MAVLVDSKALVLQMQDVDHQHRIKGFLLRGLHESFPSATGLIADCCKKYGKSVGETIYRNLTDIFNHLPFAVVIDETIACVHSGIPKSCRLEKLLELPKSVASVQNETSAYEVSFL